MDEYISREKALNFEAEIDADPDEIQAISRGMALYAEHIKALPAADVAEVVRCRTCRHFEATGLTEVTGCGFCFHDSRMIRIVRTDGFCYEGMRREAEA